MHNNTFFLDTYIYLHHVTLLFYKYDDYIGDE